jgi:MFS family permease
LNSWFSTTLAPPVAVGEDRSVREGLRRIIIAWAFGSVFFNVTTGAPLAAYVRLLGASDFAWGVISAAPMLAAVSQVIASLYIERTRRRKPIFMVCGLLHRLLWFPIAMLPWLLPPIPALRVGALVVLALVASLCAQALSPAFMSWMADFVPIRIRGAYFANRTRVGTLIAMLSAVIAGAALDLWPYLTTYSVLLSLAALCGTLDILNFRHLPEPPMVSQGAVLPLRDVITVPFKNPTFRKFLAYSAANAFSVNFMGPSLWLFVMEPLGMGKFGANLTLLGANLAAYSLVSPVWGRLADRYGNRPVLRVCMIVGALAPIPWIFATPAIAHWMWIVVFVTGSFWSGIDLGNFNLMLSLFPRERQTVYLALYAVLVGLASGIAPMIGGALVDFLKANYAAGYGLFRLGPYQVVFALSLAGRLMTAGFFLPRVHEPGAGSAKAMLQGVAGDAAERFRNFRRS